MKTAIIITTIIIATIFFIRCNQFDLDTENQKFNNHHKCQITCEIDPKAQIAAKLTCPHTTPRRTSVESIVSCDRVNQVKNLTLDQ